MNEAQKRAVEIQAEDLFDFHPMQYMTTYVTSWARLNELYPEVANNYRIEACANLLHLQREAGVVLLDKNQGELVLASYHNYPNPHSQYVVDKDVKCIQPIVEE